MSDRGRVASLKAGRIVEEDGATARPGAVLAVSTNAERRAALTEVQKQSPIEVRDLAARVVARVEGRPIDDVTDEERQRTSAALHHSHLPRLAEAGFVEMEREQDANYVRPDEDVDAATLESIEELADHESGETVLEVLADPERRRVAASLARADEPVSVTGLAESMAADGGDALVGGGTSVESIRVSLHHIHLPRLEDAGLVEYDSADARVTTVDVPEPLSDLLGA